MNELEKEIEVLPALILESMIHKDFFAYKQLSNKKEMLQHFIDMNSGTSKWSQ